MNREVMLELWCELDDAEMLVRGQMLSTVVADYELVELQKSDAMKEFRDQLDSLWQQRVKLSGIIKRKSEARLVNCVVQFHSPVPGTKRITRLDTGEFVRDEPMTAAEHQGNLFQPDPPPAPSSADIAAALGEAVAKDENGTFQEIVDREGSGITGISLEHGGKTIAEFKPRKAAKG